MLIITGNYFGAPRARKVTNTDSLEVEVGLERAAHKLHEGSDNPNAGVTAEDVLTLPEEVQHKLGFHVEEIRLPVEYRRYDEPITYVPKSDQDKILVIEDRDSNCEVYFKKGTNPFTTVGYPLERAAYESRGINPDTGPQLTYGEALDTPADFLAEHNTALTKVTEPFRVYETCAYLVPPLKTLENQVAAYIRGYLNARFEVYDQEYKPLKCMTQHWAHEFLRDKHVSLPDFIQRKIDNM